MLASSLITGSLLWTCSMPPGNPRISPNVHIIITRLVRALLDVRLIHSIVLALGCTAPWCL